MKKIYKKFLLIFTGLLLSLPSFSVMHTVTVNFSNFSPSTLSVNVGDTIQWILGGGTHTTTSLTVPAGAAAWDSPITSNVPSFEYPVTVAGNYSYVCTPHGFQGTFVATSSSGINSPVHSFDFGIFAQSSSVISVTYSIPRASDVKIMLYDVTGKSVKTLASLPLKAGDYTETYYLNDLRKGIYLVEFIAANQRFVKRIIID